MTLKELREFYIFNEIFFSFGGKYLKT